jgi:hypothetical protein
VSEREEQGRKDNRYREPQAEEPLERCSGHVDDGKRCTSEQISSMMGPMVIP